MKKYSFLCRRKSAHSFVVFTFLLFLSGGFLSSGVPILASENGSFNFQQAFKVSGTVLGLNGVVAGATVREKGTNNSVTTDAAGGFSIEVTSENATLIITHVGYVEREIRVNRQRTLTITLEQDVEQLTGVVVTALGITRDKAALGYSVENISGDRLTLAPQENVLNGLSGKVSGVTINQTGDAGSSVSMVIRGATSLNNDNQPLFVVDGVPIENTLNNVTQVGERNAVDFGNAIASISPDDVANITILKGPSAAALYGSRAGNGVVLITTRNGAMVDKLTVSASSSSVFEVPYKFLNWQHEFASGVFPVIPVELTGNALTNPLATLGSLLGRGYYDLVTEDENITFGVQLDQGYMSVQWNSPLDENGNPIKMPLVSHPNNVKNFVQTGITSQNTVSMANNSEKMQYRLSYSNMANRGLIPSSDLFRNTLGFSSLSKVNDKITVSLSLNLSRNNSNSRPASGRGTNPLRAAYDVPPQIDIRDLKEYWRPGLTGLQQRTQANTATFDNPYFLAHEVKNSFVRDRLFGNLKIDYAISKSISLMLRYGLDTYNEERELKIPYSYTQEPKGAYGQFNIGRYERNADFLLTYKKSGKKIDVSVSAGGNARFEKGQNMSVASQNGTGLVVPGVYTVQNIIPSTLQYGSSLSRRGVNSLYGLISAGWDHKVYLDITGRNDWFSTLPREEMSYFYPSASISILIDKIANFNSPDINLVKLRTGVAGVGNDASPYQLVSVLTDEGAWGDLPRLGTSSTLLNPELKPESATSYEAGIDLSLFKNRFNLSGTYYVVNNRNQIFSTDLPPSSGYTSKNINAGLLRSRGWELTVGGTPVQTNNFQWDVSVNFTRNRTRVIELADEMPYFTFWEDAKGGAWTYVGQDVGDIYGPRVRTVTDPNSPYFGYPLLQVIAGAATLVDLEAHSFDDDPVLGPNKIGNFNPKFIMGGQTGFTWKNWRLDVVFDWRMGGDFVSQTYRYGLESGKVKFTDKMLFDPGLLEGQELSDYLKAHADELIKPHGLIIPRIGWPTLEGASYPFVISEDDLGISLRGPFGGVFFPGVYQELDADGNPTGNYIENLGANILGEDPYNTVDYTRPGPLSLASTWGFTQAVLFPASYIKLRNVSLSFRLPEKFVESLKLEDASISLFTRNIIVWSKAKMGIDPEHAFQAESNVQAGVQIKQGAELYNVNPWTIPVGIKLNVTF